MFKEKNPDGSYKYAKKDGTPYNVYKDGLKIYTTINVPMQQYAEAAMKKHLSETLQPEFDKDLDRAKLRNYRFTNSIKDDVA
jgi:penicillin-binding protein 1A